MEKNEKWLIYYIYMDIYNVCAYCGTRNTQYPSEARNIGYINISTYIARRDDRC